MVLSERNNCLIFTDSGPLGDTSIESPNGSVFSIDLSVSMLKPVIYNKLAYWFKTGLSIRISTFTRWKYHLRFRNWFKSYFKNRLPFIRSLSYISILSIFWAFWTNCTCYASWWKIIRCSFWFLRVLKTWIN